MSDCGICLDYGVENVDFYSERKRHARFRHKCCECAQVILAGQSYFALSGKHEGELWSQHICLPCYEIAHIFSCDGPVLWGNLWNDMDEVIFPELDANSKCLHKLSNEAKAFLTERWFEWKERNMF